eukprot:TRINITY_DN3800_c0_g1_i1.p1 TRINITY_DN3800_c0_g1~~TRINITY_DN3800_c0_g1_i1.p1  ORF type:complete len:438 (-),score=41.03 TRINITY_DN3800_c0_g1_i1:16-1329(-)
MTRSVVLFVLGLCIVGVSTTVLFDPTVEFEKCGRPHPSWLCDPENLVNEKDALKIEEMLTFIGQNTSAPCNDKGYQVGVAIVNHMRKYNYGTSLREATRMAKDLHDEWGVGYDDCQSGVMIFLAVGDRHMYISTGAETKRHISDSQLDAIIERMKPNLKEKRYGAAILACLKDVSDLLHGRQLEPTFFERIFPYLFVVGVILFIGLFVVAARQRAAYNACAAELKKVEKIKASMLSRKFKQMHCAICLSDFPDPDPKVEQTADEEEEEEEDGDGRRAVKGGYSFDDVNVQTLRCGHQFCRSCIGEWIHTHKACPVCRESTDSHDSNNTAPRGKPTTSSYNYHGGRTRTGGFTSGNLVDYLLLDYMLNRVSGRYPRYVTPRMASRWASPSYTSTSFTSDTRFAARNPARSRSTGSSGSSGSSWGGGSSGGGGGSGGSW